MSIMSGDDCEESWINPRHLVKVLVQEPFFRAGLLVLLEDKQLQPPKVRKLVATYPQLFRIEDEVVELHPRVLFCRAYRRSTGCFRGKNCRKLHICVKYLASECGGSECTFHHDWNIDPNARILYEKFLEELSPNSLCKLMYKSYKEISELEASGEGSVGEKKEDKPTGKDTLSTSSQRGDVRIPEICNRSVNGTCRLEANGCPRLHAKRHYHWQVRKAGELWYNLPEKQVIELEQSYCNPSKENTTLSRLEPVRNGPIVIMGRVLWEAYFETLTLENSEGETLELRRLCTEVRNVEKILENTYVWYIYMDNRWKCFGKATDDKIISALSSEVIEQSYEGKDISIARFRVGRNSCIINLKSMIYTNEKSTTYQRLRRRPYPHLPEDEEFDVPPLPPTWQDMGPGRTFLKVSLNPFSSEYQDVVDSIVQAGVSEGKINKIERVQNPMLWRRFQRRVLEMLTSNVHTKHLFHSGKKNIILSICENNFDWEIQDANFTDEFGQGNYFLYDASKALRHCNKDANKQRYLFMAKVAIGFVTTGNASMREPPVDPDTNATYDSTVDDVRNPQIVVKYNKDECYPEYVITLS